MEDIIGTKLNNIIYFLFGLNLMFDSTTAYMCIPFIRVHVTNCILGSRFESRIVRGCECVNLAPKEINSFYGGEETLFFE